MDAIKKATQKTKTNFENYKHDFENLKRSIIGWKEIFQKVEERKYERQCK